MDDQCIASLNVFECASPPVWMLKLVSPIIAGVGMGFLVAGAISSPWHQELLGIKMNFWLALVVTEILHFYGSFITFEGSNIIIVQITELAASMAFVKASVPAIMFIDKSMTVLFKIAHIFRHVLEFGCLLAITFILVVMCTFVWPMPLQWMTPAICGIGIATRGFFVLAMHFGVVSNVRLCLADRPALNRLTRIITGTSWTLAFLWTIRNCISMTFRPNFALIWLAESRDTRYAIYLWMVSVVDLFTTDLPLLVVSFCVELLIWVHKKERDRMGLIESVVPQEAVMRPNT